LEEEGRGFKPDISLPIVSPKRRHKLKKKKILRDRLVSGLLNYTIEHSDLRGS